MVVFVLDSLFGFFLRVLGFDKYSCSEEHFIQSSDHLSTLTYWAWIPENAKRDPVKAANGSHTSESEKIVPLVFIHGIGAGLFPYAVFLYKLFIAHRSKPIFLVELPFVSMKLVDQVPSMHSTVYEVENMLNNHGFTEANFVGHSLVCISYYYCYYFILNFVF